MAAKSFWQIWQGFSTGAKLFCVVIVVIVVGLLHGLIVGDHGASTPSGSAASAKTSAVPAAPDDAKFREAYARWRNLVRVRDAQSISEIDRHLSKTICEELPGSSMCAEDRALMRKEADAAHRAADARLEAISSLNVDDVQKQELTGGMVRIGASPEMARLAWGDPKKVNRTITPGRISEQWVYGLSSYLYFDDGKLTSIQNSN
jgi:hypothetical protein